MQNFLCKSKKLTLAITATLLFVSQNVWACELPQVSGYDNIGDFREGLAWVEKDDKSFYIDKKGNTVDK